MIQLSQVVCVSCVTNNSVTVPQGVSQSFYRIRLVDLDGNSVYSRVDELTLSCLPNGETLSVYPNPLTSRTEMIVKYVPEGPLSQGAYTVLLVGDGWKSGGIRPLVPT